jgi:hypothetical protein
MKSCCSKPWSVFIYINMGHFWLHLAPHIATHFQRRAATLHLGEATFSNTRANWEQGLKVKCTFLWNYNYADEVAPELEQKFRESY